VARDLNTLAKVLTAKADYAGAVPLYRLALEIDEKVLGADHPTTKQIHVNLDALLEAEKKKKK
jgi:hypothetical protein